MVNDGIFQWVSYVNFDGELGDPVICPIAGQTPVGDISDRLSNEDRLHGPCSSLALERIRKVKEDPHSEPGTAAASNEPAPANAAKNKPGGRQPRSTSSLVRMMSCCRFPKKKHGSWHAVNPACDSRCSTHDSMVHAQDLQLSASLQIGCPSKFHRTILSRTLQLFDCPV